MAGRKGRKRPDPTTINPALVPSAAFTVVPRTPAPEPVPTTGLGGSAEVLNASLLGRHGIPDPGPDDEPFSDPESSLYDYQMMEDRGYMTVDMLSMGRRRKTHGGESREHDVDEHQQARMTEALESAQIHQNPESLYAMPVKRTQKQSTSHTMRTTIEVRDAMQHVHDLSSDDEMRNTDRLQRSKHQHSSARSLHFPAEIETSVKDKPAHPSASTPIQTQKSRGGKGASPVSVEEKLVQEIIEPVHHANRLESIPDEPMMSARQQSARSVSMADDRVKDLEAEREHLASLTSQLENEVLSYREVVSTYESGDSEAAASLLTKKQINDLREENESLKNSIKRLHVELSAYQAKYRPPNSGSQGEMHGMPSNGPPPSWLFNIRYLNPLFLAYDDRIREREETIRKCQTELDGLRQRTETVVKENEKLHSRMGGTLGGPIDNTDWEQMKDNARLVLEENQNLLEQINVKDQKSHDLHQAHLRELSKLSKQVMLYKSEKDDVDKQLEETRQTHRDLKHKYDTLVLDSQGVITQEQHIKEISDLKQKLSDMEEHHKQEIVDVNNKLHASQMERKAIGAQMIELAAENRRHQAESKLMQKSVRRAQQKMLFLSRAIETSENKEMSVQEYMSSLIKVAEKNAQERDTYEKVLKEQEIENKRKMKKLLHENHTVGKMEEKLKLYKMKAAARIGTVAERLKDQEELFNSQKKEYEREINHLRNIIREKEGVIQYAVVEKRELEDQMEAVWQSANSENVRIKDDLQKSVHQLRKHAGLSEAIDAQDKLETLYVSSDDEAGEKREIS